MSDTEVDELFFFLLGESRAFLWLIVRKDDLLHRGKDMQVLAGEIEDAAEDLIQLLRRAVLALVDETEKITLQFLPRDVRDRSLAENGQQVSRGQPLVFLAGAFFARLALDLQPFFKIFGKAGFGACAVMYGPRIGNGRRMFARHLFEELGGKLALHLFEVFGAGKHLEAVSAVMRFVDAFMEAIGDEPVCTGKNVTIFFRHTFDLLFG